jgi:HD-GYP domain-containing protein (c-di-GMP phosphodiesterase class II)
VLTPAGTGAPVTAADVQKVFTAPLAVGSTRGLYLTVVFGGNPDRLAHDLLALLHAHMQLVLDQSIQRSALASLQLRVAERLLTPYFQKHPDLRRHSEAVANVAVGFARYLALPPADVENVRLLALVHDVGLRVLDYDRLYRKRDLTPEEMSLLREHPVVGAAMVEPLLGADIARAVLSHHERVDGRGYPAGLHGEEIPMLSRILQICDAWVAMTDPESYQTPSPPELALATIANAASGQFDAELAVKFAEMIRRM